MKLDKQIRTDLNSRIFSAMFALSGQKATKNQTPIHFYIDNYHLETNFITGEIIWVNKDIEIYLLPYLISDDLSISIYKADKLIAREIINVDTQTKKLLNQDWSTHDYVNFLISISTRKILEFKNLINKKN